MNINIKRMGHVALHVEDVEKAAKFYNENFGFEIVFIFPDWGMVRRNKEDIAFIKKDESHHDPHFGLRVSSKEEVDKAKKILEAKGVEIITDPKLHRDDSYSLYFKDPDGNVAEIIFDPNI